MINSEKIKLGISACLLGENVRYDGGHKLDKFIKETLGQYVEYVAVCPEVECGLGIPRESMHLEGETDAPRLVTTRTKVDLTRRMVNWAQKRVRELEKEDLCGFIFKSDSPSSGMERVKIYNENKMPVKKGVGIFAGIFMDYFPVLPVEDEGRLHGPDLRENFIERIFAFRRWRESLKNTKGRESLLHFHTTHKLLILSHSTKHYQIMGKLVADQKKIPLTELRGKYEILLLEALSLRATSKKHTNVLQHMMGYFKEQLSADEKAELLEIIGDYHKGFVPLVVPVTLIKHYARKYRQNYLTEQVYLNPHPTELKLRNHV
jgi:uncharacterized protein YbgA (DUF1722 family)/uncharacterized protein YbbK (DUF523 family)